MKRFQLLTMLAPLLMLGAIAFAVRAQPVPAAQLSAASAAPQSQGSPIKVGVPITPQNALEVVGKIEQDGATFTEQGYLTHIAGLDESLLFTGSNPAERSEATARFTFASTAYLSTRAVLQNIFVLTVHGTTDIYFYEPGGASFDDPSSFRRGTLIATLTGRYQNVLNVQAPNSGIATGVGYLTQTLAEPFVLSGQQYQLGQTGLLERVHYTGQGTRTDATVPRATTVYGGYVVVTGRSGAGPQSYLPWIAKDALGW